MFQSSSTINTISDTAALSTMKNFILSESPSDMSFKLRCRYRPSTPVEAGNWCTYSSSISGRPNCLKTGDYSKTICALQARSIHVRVCES
ncbi:hypothetical protein CY34DRAFT_345816 [Suillus luteus UH-Slu-Lm8-n1]|uniref:Uncharacterized protein n=1 Tax=Suillus luteus UH-Slu-Lm8-n1 TaxID=930992 RepID=A0A0D0AMC6_9AGAM|nr:hypothetical protein CY34DRAFT_345816 [Suillus luteus UH-Slu-Lm8-n1]